MRLSSVARLSPAALPARLPLTIDLHTSASSTVLMLALLLPLALAMLSPFVLVATAAAANPAVQATLFAKPALLVQITLGLATWVLLFGWPLTRIAEEIAHRRSVRIAGGCVAIVDESIFATRCFDTPITSYEGVEHRIRASISGLRHELVLVHADPSLSVLLTVAPRLIASDVEAACTLLGVRALSAPASVPQQIPATLTPLAA